MRTVSIAAPSRTYEASIEAGLLRQAGLHVAAAFPGKKVFVITVPPVRKRWGGTLKKSLKQAAVVHEFLEIGDGERAKTLATVEALARRLARRGAERSSVIVAFGGGVVGDVAGFLASIYMRGVECVQVPTTLLAQVDAAIGGKTAVNLKEGKNLLGTFRQPHSVLIDPAVLATLPERAYRAGLYEALKCGVICDPALFSFMEQERERLLQRDPQILEHLIEACVRVKAEVVAADERESGLRRILNFGHTIGHALEAESGYRRFLHGEAVAWGMVAAALLAVETGRAEAKTAQRIVSLVRAYGPLPPVKARAKSLARRLPADKKTRDGVVHFVLPDAIGRVQIASDVSSAAVVRAIEGMQRLSQA